MGACSSTDFREHQPWGGRLGRVEQRVAAPCVHHVVHPQVRTIERVSGLVRAHGEYVTYDYARNCSCQPALAYASVSHSTI